MDLSQLSSNWKKLQSTFKETEQRQPSSQNPSQHGVKRKREPPRGISKPLVQILKPRKKVRFGKTMAAPGLSTTGTKPIQEIEVSESSLRPRLPDRTISENVNAGLSSSFVYPQYLLLSLAD